MSKIESIQPEYAAFELDRIGREETDATATAALTALLHNVTGCDIPQTDTTPQSDVDELVPLCLSILRRHWTTPLTALGDGTTPMSLADLLRRLIGDRVQGNEAWCIPPVHDNIPTAVAALRERKIGGVPELPDGLSFARIFCDSTIPPITELIDDNIGWTADRNNCLTRILQQFTNLQSITLNCIEATTTLENSLNQQTDRTITLYFPYLATFPQMNIISQYYVEREPSFIAHLPAVKTTNFTGNGYTPFYVRELYMPNYEQGVYILGGSGTYANIHTTKLYIGCKGAKNTITRVWHNYSQTTLTDLEIGEGACQNITLSNLDGLTPENIYNHILCRLKQDEPMCGEGVTITLGTTNIDKIEAVEEYNLKLTELTDIYGYTFA